MATPAARPISGEEMAAATPPATRATTAPAHQAGRPPTGGERQGQVTAPSSAEHRAGGTAPAPVTGVPRDRPARGREPWRGGRERPRPRRRRRSRRHGLGQETDHQAETRRRRPRRPGPATPCCWGAQVRVTLKAWVPARSRWPRGRPGRRRVTGQPLAKPSTSSGGPRSTGCGPGRGPGRRVGHGLPAGVDALAEDQLEGRVGRRRPPPARRWCPGPRGGHRRGPGRRWARRLAPGRWRARAPPPGAESRVSWSMFQPRQSEAASQSTVEGWAGV